MVHHPIRSIFWITRYNVNWDNNNDKASSHEHPTRGNEELRQHIENEEIPAYNPDCMPVAVPPKEAGKLVTNMVNDGYLSGNVNYNFNKQME